MESSLFFKLRFLKIAIFLKIEIFENGIFWNWDFLIPNWDFWKLRCLKIDISSNSCNLNFWLIDTTLYSIYCLHISSCICKKIAWDIHIQKSDWLCKSGMNGTEFTLFPMVFLLSFKLIDSIASLTSNDLFFATFIFRLILNLQFFF